MRNNLFNLPDNWQWVKSESVIDVRDGTHDTPEYHSDGVPFITSKNLVNGSVDFNGAAFISLKDHNKFSQRSKVDNGDILLAMIGTIGNPVLVETDREFSIKNVALFKFTGSDVNNRYFRHLLDSKIIKRQMALASRGGTQKFVSLKVLRNLNIPLPPLAEQKRIAAILDKADMLRTKRRAALAKLDSLVQSVFLEMFGDPVTNPMGWETKLFEHTVAIDAPMVDPRENQYKHLLHIGGDRIERDTGRILGAKTAEEDMLISGKFLFDDRYILYSKIRPNLRKVVMPDFRGLCSADVYPVRPLDNMIGREILFQILLSESFTRFTKQHSGRANIPKINRKQFMSFECYIPPINLQNNFVDFVKCMGPTRLKSHESNYQSDNLFHALQQRAFRGEL